MNIGHLNIPKPEMEKVAFVHDIQTRLYLQYSKLLENEGYGKKILKVFEEDQRVKALEGHMISSGSGASRFETKTLAMWFLWAINEYGNEIAELNLNRFLDSETVPVINTLWVLGIEVDQIIELENGVKIIAIENMPDSRDKEQYLKHDFGNMPHRMPKPKAAITYEVNINKSNKDDDFSNTFEKDKEFWESSKKLNELSLLLNALEGVSCIPFFSTSYTLPEMPIGMFGGSGGGSPLHDIIGFRTSKLSANCADQLNSLLTAFTALNGNNITRFTRVLSRLSQAKRREQIEDKILDLGIALEMALLEDNKNNSQLSLSFRLRGSWLIGSDHEERQVIYKQLRDIYNYRSQVAHSGSLCGNDAEKINSVREMFQEYSQLAERIIQQLICTNNPDWSKLILGGI